jgi:hypothetical protein
MVPKSGNWFSDKIMRHFDKLAREPQISMRNLRKPDCDAPGTHFAGRERAAQFEIMLR